MDEDISNLTEEQLDEMEKNPMLNTEYVKKLRERFRQYKLSKEQELSQVEKDYLEEQSNNPINKINNPLVKQLVETLNDPTKSKVYRDEILFNTPGRERDRLEGECKKKWDIHIPIISGTF